MHAVDLFREAYMIKIFSYLSGYYFQQVKETQRLHLFSHPVRGRSVINECYMSGLKQNWAKAHLQLFNYRSKMYQKN